MRHSESDYIHPCAEITLNVWKKNGGKTNTTRVNLVRKRFDTQEFAQREIRLIAMMRNMIVWGSLLPLCIGLGPSVAHAEELKILPADVTLTGPHASQRLLVVAEDNGQIAGDQTPQAKFSSSHPAIAAVDSAGVVRAAADGEATITAVVDGKQTTVKVTVRKTKEPSGWSFRNHVIPMMTRAGCNSGACHGALAGKGGLKLSLRGYDPDSDHFVLTRQALGRRVDRSEPARSLVLLKPTRAVQHGGGQKIEPGSADFTFSPTGLPPALRVRAPTNRASSAWKWSPPRRS